MIGGGALDRVVAVLAGGQGSGVLLDRRLVLTAQHVIEGSDAIEVIHPSESTPVACTVMWADKDADVAVLHAGSDVLSAERAAPLGGVRFGRIATGSPLPHCQIVGFPAIQRYGDLGEDLEYDQYRASVLPMAGRMRNVLVCELDRPAADEGERRTSPLHGLSGAPVFAGAVLLGIVAQVPRNRFHLRVEAASIEAVVRDRPAPRIVAHIEDLTDVHPQDEQFEVRYAADLSSQYRRTEIFGIDELGRGESRWDLDTAYLSLEAEPATEAVADEESASFNTASLFERSTSAPQRIDTLLVERPRALLRGEAGAGKTTLVWWLAAHAANNTLGEHLAPLNGLVPFVVPLREVHARGGRFPTVSELLSAGRVITDGAPDGWARRVLEARRGLLLVDGLDEVPEREREEARRWLVALLDRYPHTRCLATVRPNAVDKDWLAQDGFAELTLLPMSDGDIRTFVGAWHDAARLECGHLFDARRGDDERELLTTLEQGLVHQLGENPALRELARTPLLCAVICALHRRRRGLLPTTRWSLYRAALAMLLGGRDAARGVAGTDTVRLDSDEQHALLQRLAIWLVRTGQQQMTHAQAVQQLDLALRDMPAIREQATTERVLRFLLDRSGLLQERTDDAIQFIHRTFQEFLAAKEFHESGYILELLEHAHKEAWQDVIVLAVGHATRKDAHELIEKLVEFGEAAEGRDERWHLVLLAARCAISLRSLDAGLMDRVRGCVRSLMPLTDAREAGEFAGLGEWAVELLPGPDGLDEVAAELTVMALLDIRSARIWPSLRAFATYPGARVNTRIADGWDLHPIDEYAREVLAGMHVGQLTIDSHAKLVHLGLLRSSRSLIIRGGFSEAELNTYLPVKGIEEIMLADNELVESLDFLRNRADLKGILLTGRLAVRDLSVLQHLSLATLDMHVAGLIGEQLQPLAGISSLRTLRLVGDPSDGWAALEAHPGVRRLSMDAASTEWLARLHTWANLEELDVDCQSCGVTEVLEAVSRAPQVSRLTLWVDSLSRLRAAASLPCVRRLELLRVEDHMGLAQLPDLFPGLEELQLRVIPTREVIDVIDLTPLLDLPDLRVELGGVVREGLRILGEEALGDRLSDRLVYVRPHR